MRKSDFDCVKCDKEIIKICPGHYADDWYGPYEIRFCRNQMFFLISYLEQLKHDSWPVNPNLEGYEDMLRGEANFRGAPFLTARETGIEVSWRVERTGEDGDDLLIQIVSHGVKDIWLLTNRARQAFIYVSGYRRKEMPYAQWKRQRIYRMNTKSIPSLLTN